MRSRERILDVDEPIVNGVPGALHPHMPLGGHASVKSRSGFETGPIYCIADLDPSEWRVLATRSTIQSQENEEQEEVVSYV